MVEWLIWGMFGKVWCGKIQIRGADATFRDNLAGQGLKQGLPICCFDYSLLWFYYVITLERCEGDDQLSVSLYRPKGSHNAPRVRGLWSISHNETKG